MVRWPGAEVGSPAGRTGGVPGLIPWPHYVEWLPGHLALSDVIAIDCGPLQARAAAEWLRQGLVEHCRSDVSLGRRPRFAFVCVRPSSRKPTNSR